MPKTPKLDTRWIDDHALEIVEALQRRGHTTYLVGGCVRDLILGSIPKDFDIATMAKPLDVKKIVPRSYVIGKRFRLVLAKRGNQQFEIATFRRNIREDDAPEDVPEGDNLFGSPEEDAARRDFTINALFFDPLNDDLIDYSQGLDDLRDGIIRMIGEPVERLIEDPIRIMRALRLAHKANLSIEVDLRQAMTETANALPSTALPRRREEFLKFLRVKHPGKIFLEAQDLGMLEHIAPTLNELLLNEELSETFMRYLNALHDKPINKDDAVELFAPVVLAYVRTCIETNPEKPIRAKELLEHPELQKLMRDELGMFKHEQASVTKALQLQSFLCRREIFERRGQRRQVSILANESFLLALSLADRDCAISAADLFFWREIHRKLAPAPTPKGPRRKRPPRKRPPRKKS